MLKIKGEIPDYGSTVNNSFLWKLWHGINYLIGGITFPIGSLMYYPYFTNQCNGAFWGGWLFTIGSLTFLFADLTEWNHFRPGCLGPLLQIAPNIEPDSITSLDAKERLEMKFKYCEMGINFMISVTGSFLYFVGSALFIPPGTFQYEGQWLFIIGSAFIVISQSWKCIRTATTDEKNLQDKSFKCSNISPDFAGFQIDLHAGLGGLMYFIGTIMFLYAQTNQQIIYATTVYVCGGLFFFISGSFMQYRYFLNKQPQAYDTLD